MLWKWLCRNLIIFFTDKSANVGEFEWDQFTRGMVLSAFSYGYLTTQILGGRLTELYGIKKVYGLCLLVCGILTALSPPVAKLGGVYAFMALRALQGTFDIYDWFLSINKIIIFIKYFKFMISYVFIKKCYLLLLGVCEGVTFPSLHAMTARWVPPNERNSFIARSYFGSTFGTIGCSMAQIITF